MTVREILDLAKVSPLGSYSMKDDDEHMLILLNHAIVQVYNRLTIITQIQPIQLVIDKTRYEYLDSAYKIISATMECGTPININSDTDRYSVFDMGNHVLDIPMCVQDITNSISLLLHMKPPTITCENFDTTEFTPDDALVPPILSYMAYMVNTNIKYEDGVGHFNDFLRSIDELERLGKYSTYSHLSDVVFENRGWC